MSRRLVCPQGHRWDEGLGSWSDSSTQPQRVACPICGALCELLTVDQAHEATVGPPPDRAPSELATPPWLGPEAEAEEWAERPRFPGYEVLRELGRGEAWGWSTWPGS
jgi:hypothetical protein